MLNKLHVLCNLKGFLSARQLNPNTPVKLIKEELEPTEFKQYFNPWESFVSFGNTKTHGVGVGIATKGNTYCMYIIGSSDKYTLHHTL